MPPKNKGKKGKKGQDDDDEFWSVCVNKPYLSTMTLRVLQLFYPYVNQEEC